MIPLQCIICCLHLNEVLTKKLSLNNKHVEELLINNPFFVILEVEAMFLCCS